MQFDIEIIAYTITNNQCCCLVTKEKGNMRETYIFQNTCFGLVLVLLRIYVALAVFQPYRDLAAGDNRTPDLLLRKPRA